MKKNKILYLIICSILSVMFILPAFGCSGGKTDGSAATSDKKDEVRVEKTLMVGDSLFDFWKDDCANDLKGAVNLVNIAVGGTNSVYWQKSGKLIARENPTTIIMCLGTNDIADLNRTGECAARGGDRYEQCLQGVLESFKQIVPDVHIYYLTVNICGESTRWNKREDIKTCNAIMREYCADKDWVEIVETEYAFYDNDDYNEKPNPDYFVSDYLHFSRQGYVKLTGILRAALGLDK